MCKGVLRMPLTKMPEVTPSSQRIFFIREEIPYYSKHDQLLKQLIEMFFEEFLEAFFPEIREQIEFERITFFPKERLTELFSGNKRVLHFVTKGTWNKNDALVSVHVKPQSSNLPIFNKMFTRLHMIEKLICSLVIYRYEEAWDKNKYSVPFSDLEVLNFHYFTLHLRKQNWRTFIEKDNPVAAAFFSKMGYAEDEKVKVKLEFYKTLARLKLDLREMDVLVSFFETDLTLSDIEKAIFIEEVKKLHNADEILEILFDLKKWKGNRK